MSPIVNGQDNRLMVGIDIGSANITCAIGQADSSINRIKLRGISSTLSTGIKRGTITNRNELIDTLEKVINDTERMANIKITNALLSITGEHIRSINTQAAIPLNRTNGVNGGIIERSINDFDIFQVLDLAQAVSLPIDRDILHTLPQEYIVDTLNEIKDPLGMTGRRLEGKVHLVTAAKTAMTNLVSCIEELGITVDGLVFQPLAAALATLNNDEMELGITLVDIGSTTTSIAVYHEGTVQHSATIPIGSSSITNDIAVMLQVSIDEAEMIKMKYASAKSSMSSPDLEIKLPSKNGGIDRSIPEKEVSKYVEARMQEIFQMVIREIARANIKDPLTYGIVITGGGAELRNIVSLAENSMGVKVRKGTPINIDGAQDIADGPHHSTAMGLLLWPLYTTDHLNMKMPKNRSIKGLLEKIRHTIEDMF
jgi:cell division protein FtsA